MKKVLLIFVASLMLACSGDDSNDSVNNPSAGDFHPPAWIQGTWGDPGGNGLSATPLFKFKQNDLCAINLTMDFCYQDNIDQIRSVGQTATVTEEISDNKYYVTLNYQGGQTIFWKFDKLSANQIKWTNNQNITLTKL